MKNSKEIDIAQKLIRCKSIAPKDGGTLRIVEKECKAMGLKCTKLRFSEKGLRLGKKIFFYFYIPPSPSRGWMEKSESQLIK